MNRQEFRVLTTHHYADGAEIVPAQDRLGGWELWCEMSWGWHATHGGRAALEDRPGQPSVFPSIEKAAETARSFGHLTSMIFFTREEWLAIVDQ